MVQQGETFFQIQVARKSFLQSGGLQILHRVFRQELGLGRQVFIKGPNRGDFSGPGGGVQAVMLIGAAGVNNAVARQVAHVGIDILERYGPDKGQIDVLNRNLVKGHVRRDEPPVQL